MKNGVVFAFFQCSSLDLLPLSPNKDY